MEWPAAQRPALRGRHRRDSDLDLLVVMNGSIDNPRKESVRIRRALNAEILPDKTEVKAFLALSKRQAALIQRRSRSLRKSSGARRACSGAG